MEDRLNDLARQIDGVELVFGRRAANTGKLVHRGALLVRPSTGKTISLEDANEALAQGREHDIGD